jgi:ribokinase
MGRQTFLIAAVGGDQFGQDALIALRDEGVDISGVQIVEGSTGIATVFVGGDGENLIGVASGANERLRSDVVRATLHARIQPGDVVVADLEVDDLAVGAAAAVARELGAWFVLNPAPARPLSTELLACCDVITPNALEILGLGFTRTEQLLAAGVGAVVVTRGARGADLHSRSLGVIHQDAFPVDAIDTTGAGDAFTSGLAVALAFGEPLQSALRWAAAAGSLATRQLGSRTAYPTAEELFRTLADQRLGRQHLTAPKAV